jgi:hypothetical protein
LSHPGFDTRPLQLPARAGPRRGGRLGPRRRQERKVGCGPGHAAARGRVQPPFAHAPPAEHNARRWVLAETRPADAARARPARATQARRSCAACCRALRSGAARRLGAQQQLT